MVGARSRGPWSSHSPPNNVSTMTKMSNDSEDTVKEEKGVSDNF